MDVFQEAAKAAQQRCGDGSWFVLTPQEQTRRIYDEMRRIDAEQAAAAARQGAMRPAASVRGDGTLAA